MQARNTFIIFIISGFWHGAGWTYFFWSFLNTIYVLPSIFLGKKINDLDIVAMGKKLPTFKELVSILITFGLTVFAFIFFRAENMSHALNYCKEIFSVSFFTLPQEKDFTEMTLCPRIMIILVLIFLSIEWIGREHEHALAELGLKWKRPLRYTMYYAIIITIFWLGGNSQEYIYFQF
jgi:hypothetical protein